MLFESPHVRIESDDQIATLTLDFAHQTANGFTLAALDDLEKAFGLLREMEWLDLLVVRSAKQTGFSPGHALEQLTELCSPEERQAYAGRGQQIFQMLSQLPSGTASVAVIEGVCHGAGLELALACDYRVAVQRPDTTFAFPEVKRNSVPCWGATQRLPQIVGIRPAIAMLIGGASLTVGVASRSGLIDCRFVERRMRIEFQTFLDRLQDAPGRRLKRTDSRPWRERLHDAIPFLRSHTFAETERQLRTGDVESCPAKLAILRSMEAGFADPGVGWASERKAFAVIGASSAYRESLRLEQRARQPLRIYPEPINPIPNLPRRIGIVGNGKMAIALAARFLLAGHEVVIQESKSARRAEVETLAAINMAAKQGLIASENREAFGKALQTTTTWQGFDELLLAIEAVEEDLGVKRTVFDELEQRVRPRTVLATTSSTIRVEAIQAELQRPGRIVGIHFPDGWALSRVVELVRAPATTSDTLATMEAWLRGWNFTPILVGDHPGRLIQRVQMAYWSEAVMLVSEGLPIEAIDGAMCRFGMDAGPLATIDAIGFEKLASQTNDLLLARGDRFAQNLLLERMRAMGWDGRSRGEGFYRYGRGRVRPNQLARMILWNDKDDDSQAQYTFDPEEAIRCGTQRLILRTINEAAASLGDEADAEPATIDLALTRGANWAVPQGGPLRYADHLGLEAVVTELTDLAERFGKRFQPCLELQRRADAGESFYGTVLEPVPAIDVPVRRVA